MGYWALYVFSPGALTLLGAQSAFERNLLRTIQESDGNWLNRHFENLIHSTLPDQRYIPWGDLQSGPNGGVIGLWRESLMRDQGDEDSTGLTSARGSVGSGSGRFRADTA